MKTTLKACLLAASFLPATARAGEIISYDAKGAFPEGIAYSPVTELFLVSSMRLGSVGAVGRDGRYRVFSDDASLVSSVGMTADVQRGRLLVCVSDPGFSLRSTEATKDRLARLAIFDLSSRKLTGVIDLAALLPDEPHFANDVAVDAKGNAYVTDSFSPVIYRVDVSGKAAVFVRDDAFKGEGFNLNGVVVHPRGFLLVAKYNAGKLFKVSLSAPPVVQEVVLKEPLPSADGLVLDPDGTLFVVQNAGANRVVRLSSADGWKSAAVTAVAGPYAFPTTAVRAGGRIYVNEVHLGELFDPKAPKDRSRYTIKEAEFKSGE